MRSTGRRLLVAPLLGLALVIGACGSGGGEAEPAAPMAAPAPSGKDVPKRLAKNRAQANEIIDGSTKALRAKLADLRGYPVVVNQWGSWCPPCRAEFPFFASVARAQAREVAFVGVDIQDDRGAAEEFLAELPVPYPSIFDQGADAVRSIDWSGVSPTTWFIDKRGKIVHQRPGAYPNRAALESDMRTFLRVG